MLLSESLTWIAERVYYISAYENDEAKTLSMYVRESDVQQAVHDLLAIRNVQRITLSKISGHMISVPVQDDET